MCAARGKDRECGGDEELRNVAGLAPRANMLPLVLWMLLRDVYRAERAALGSDELISEARSPVTVTA